MAFTAFRGMRPGSQLLFTFIVIVISFILFMVVAAIVAIPFFEMNFFIELSKIDDLTNPDTLNFLKYFQTVQSIGIFIIPPIIVAWLFHGKIKEYLLLNKKVLLTSAFMVVILIAFANPIINYIGAINADMNLPDWLSGVEEWMRINEENAARLTEAFLNVNTISGLLFNLFMIALIPAIGEELLFRGVIQKIFTQMTKSHNWGIWISAIIFSALHFQFYGFLPRMLLGVMFGYLLVWSGSLWLPIIAHFVNNGMAVLAMWFVKQGNINPSIEEIGATPDSLYMAIISLVLCLLLMWLIKRQQNPIEIIR